MRTLVVVPSVRAVPDGDGLFLDRKAVEGLELYAQLWPGPVRCLMRVGDRSTIGYGATYAPADLPFAIELIPDDLRAARAAFANAAVVLAAGDSHLDFAAVDVTRAPVAFIIEYTLATRLRINRLSQPRALARWKSAAWTVLTEARRRRAFRRAAGLQCNGTPAYDAYRRLSPDALLYFDTRTRAAAQISSEQLAAKQAGIRADAPLRIAFSGRLEPMKGADHLIPVARALAQSEVAFHLDIYGDGSLRGAMAAAVARDGLHDRVTLHGPVPFDTALIPAMIERTDLFLCCHRQADPSCTYLETLGCGVPIVGYDNAAFVGVLGLGDVGVAVAMDDPDAAARAIAALASDRDRLATLAGNAASISRAHSFESVFAARVAHLRRIAGAI